MTITSRGALSVVFGIGVFGLCFSGYLSYLELFAKTSASCPSLGAPGTVFGYPACVYGFFMYVAVVIIAAIGLSSKK